MIKLHVKLKLLYIKICNIIKFLKFSFFLYKQHVFRDGNPSLVLRVIQKYIELESSNFSDSLCLGRSIKSSTKLLSTLIDEYFETKSERALNNTLEVLKEEFIKRNRKSDK